MIRGRLRSIIKGFGGDIRLTKRLPRTFGRRPIIVTPQAYLRYWTSTLGSIHADLLAVADQLLRPGDCVWDVGANVGAFTFAAAQRVGARGAVIAIEPDVDMCSLLYRTRALARACEAPVDVLPVAVADLVGLTRFAVSAHGTTTSALEGYGRFAGTRDTRLVPTVTLDWLSTQVRPPALIKVDVEGAEVLVLRGGIALFETYRPLLVCETGADSAPAIASMLLARGYKFFDMRARLEHRIELPQPPGELLAIPAEKAAFAGNPTPLTDDQAGDVVTRMRFAANTPRVACGTSPLLRPLTCLQIGAEWLPERPGGLNRFFFELLHHLPAAGVACRGLVVGTAASWPADSLAGVRVDAYAPIATPLPKRWLAGRLAVAAAVAADRPDLIAAHFAPYAWAALPHITPDRPLVVHFQGPWAQESREEGGGRLACVAKQLLERQAYRRATRLIVLSPPFRDVLVNRYGIPADRVRVVPGGVDCDRYDVPTSRSDARRRLGWPAGRPIVLAVRRLARRMGLENLIAAADVVRRAVPDVLVLIAGGGRQRDALAGAIRQRGLGDHVRLLGFVPDADLPLAYRAADLSVVPTVSLEGFGLVAAESLAAGTPALATPVDGLVDLLSGLSPELLFTAPSAAAIADGLTAALTGTYSLPTGAACAAYARRRFNWPVIAAAVADVYRDALA